MGGRGAVCHDLDHKQRTATQQNHWLTPDLAVRESVIGRCLWWKYGRELYL